MRLMRRFRHLQLLGAALLVLPALAQGAPDRERVVIRAPGDSVLIRFGDSRTWIRLTSVPSPDTTYLDRLHDLGLITAADSVTIPGSMGRANVLFIRAADTLAETFLFEKRSARDLVKYRALLKEYSRFSQTPLEPVPAFDSFRNETEELRRAFPLDSIAGGGGELSRMLRLLHWVHTRIRWDGSQENPRAATLAEEMNLCMTQGRTMNCGGLAASYVAACRALGLSARRIVCLPFDKTDPDCHSVAIVFSDSLRQWVYMDPTFEAYWTDASGHLLDLERARALLAAGDSVLVDPEANVNGEPREAVDHLAYMSKNLFRFKTWADSLTTIYLNPSDYPFDSGNDPHAIVTTSAAAFWTAPKFSSR